MSILEAIRLGFTRYLKYEGRASRVEFWAWLVFYVALVGGSFAVEGSLPTEGGFGGLGRLLALVLLSPTLAVGVRRMHDIGKSGWMLAIPLYDLYLAALPGDPATNAYGVVPGANEPGWGARQRDVNTQRR